MKKRKQIKASVLAVLMVAVLFIGCSKDDDTQPQTETPGEETPTGEVDKAPEISAQTFTTKEDVADDTVIGTVVATDPEGKALTFTLTKNSDDLFELTNAGELSLVADKKLDFETVTSYTLTVEVSDGKNKVSADITVTIENVVEPFITTWKTTMANEKVFIITNASLTYNYTIDWGDGTVENNQTGSKSHTYATAGTYTVSISGVFPAIGQSKDSSEKLLTIEQWGDIVWESFSLAFFECTNMTYKATDRPNLSKVTSMASMFARATSFNGDLSSWDVSNVTNMASMFTRATSFNGDISTWDVSKVTTMFFMFNGASSFAGDVSTWDVSKVINMRAMFNGARSFNRDLNKWDVSNVIDMLGMFGAASSFNGDISSWDVSKVTNMLGMFQSATSFAGDLSSWNVSKVTDMKAMFNQANSFTGDISTWDVSKVTDMEFMLNRTKLSTATYDALLTKWAALPNLQSNVTLGVQGLTYCGGTRGRNTLINDKGWTIKEDAVSSNCF